MTGQVSLTMIARDEQRVLPRCLASVADLVDEIVFVDTGSTDSTRRIAAQARDRHGRPARVFSFVWIDDFSAARNEALRRAHGDWIFWMDCDDWLDGQSRLELQHLLATLGEENAVYQMIHASPASVDGGHPASAAPQDRLFRRLPEIRWEGRVHEQIAPSAARSGAILRRTNIAVLHSGYGDAELRRRKVERNLRLLEWQNIEQPHNAHTLFYLGMSYGMAGRPAEAILQLEHALELLPPRSRFRPRAYLLLADCWRLCGNAARALEICGAGLSFFPDDPELRRMKNEEQSRRSEYGIDET